MKTVPVAHAAMAPARPKQPADYLDLYGLAKPPFGDAIDRTGFILFNSHTRAFQLLVEHLTSGSGVIALQGEDGIGKTQALDAAATVAKEAGVQTVIVSRPPVGRVTLDQLVAALNGTASSEAPDTQAAITRFFEAPRKALLVDDADLVPGDCVRLLLALARQSSNSPGGSVMVLGNSTDLPPSAAQPELAELFGIARNTVRLPRLGFAEIRQFIERSLWIAGGTTRRLIAADAMKLIIARSNGLPATTNRLMEAVLAAGFARGDTMITAKTVAAAVGPPPSRPRPRPQPRQETLSSGVPARALQLVAAGLLMTGVSLFLYKALQGGPDRSGGLQTEASSSAQVSPQPPPDMATAPRRPQASSLPTEKPTPVRPTVTLPPDLISALLKRGNQSLDLGDISAARLLFGRAAEAGNGAAATALGKTYDPRYSAMGQTPEPSRAAEWYRQAIALGDTEAAVLLKRLDNR